MMGVKSGSADREQVGDLFAAGRFGLFIGRLLSAYEWGWGGSDPWDPSLSFPLFHSRLIFSMFSQ